MIEIGCAWLQKPSKLSSGGWASLAGGEPFAFTDLEYLRGKGPIWVTQASPKNFVADGGNRFPWMRNADFLTTPLNTLAEELAVSESPQKAAAALSEVLTRTVNMCLDAAPGMDRFLLDPKYSQCALHEVLQLVATPSGRKLELPSDLIDAMPSLFQGYRVKDSMFADILVRVPVCRVAMYERVKNQVIPGDTWVEIPEGLYPNPLNWAIKSKTEVIAHVAIMGRVFNPKEKDSNTRNDLSVFHDMHKGSRRWMALPEIQALSKIFDLKALRTFICSEIVPLGATMRISPPIFSPVARASISAGLMAEAFVSAAALPSPVFHVSDQGKPLVSPYSIRAAYVSSVARATMIEAAVDLAKQKVGVQGVGLNHLIVGTKKDRLRGLRFAINKNPRLSYPTGLRVIEEKNAPRSRAVLSADASDEPIEEIH